MEETSTAKPKCFRIPKLAWLIWVLWAAFNVWVVTQVGFDNTVMGRLTAQVLLPLAAAFIVTYPVWFIFRRSQGVASFLFTLVLIFLAISMLFISVPSTGS